MTGAIDPGTTTGLALCDADGVVQTWSGHLFDAIEKVAEWQQMYNVAIWIVEEPPRPTFWHGESDHRKREKISRNVGSVQRDAKLVVEFLVRRGIHFVKIKPRDGKWGPSIVEAVTGYTGRTNQHVRDAIRLAWAYRRVME